MPDFKKMTVQSLRELARKVLGPGYSRLKTKSDLVRALQDAAAGAARGSAPRRAATRAAAATGKAVRVAKEAGKTAREGARAVARAGKAAVGGAAEGARAAAKATRARKPGKVATAAATVAGAAAGAASGIAASRRSRRAAAEPPMGAPDPEGYFVARVRGEEAMREAPHPMTEAAPGPYRTEPEPRTTDRYDEGLGELPWSYGDDAFVALARDPHTLFVYWDHATDTVARTFDGLDGPRVQLWVLARADGGWERVRTIEFALESRGYYVHDLEPGRTYRAEIHIVDRQGRERLLASSSNEVALPRVGPSPIIDDRFIRIPWDLPLGRMLGPGHAGGPFSDEARALLARLSDWTRFAGPVWGGSAGGIGGRPSSPTSSPSSPFGREPWEKK